MHEQDNKTATATQRADAEKPVRRPVIVRSDIPSPVVVVDAEVVSKAESLAEQAAKLRKITPGNADDARNVVQQIARLDKDIEKQRKEITRPINDLKKAIDTAAKDVCARLQRAKRPLASRIAEYDEALERERKRAEAEARRRIEEARREAERREAERQRALEELRSEASTPEALWALADLEDQAIDDEIREAVIPLPEIPERQKSPVYVRKRQVAEVVELERVPAMMNGQQLLKPDLAAIKRLLVAGVDVPGCRLVTVTDTGVRS